MEPLFAAAIGLLTAAGVYLCLRSRIFPVLLGLSLLSYAVNLFLVSSGRLVLDGAPLANLPQARFPDPLPQALVLTAIVIGFAMTAFLVVVAIRAHGAGGSEHVDGECGERAEREESGAPAPAARDREGVAADEEAAR